MADRADDLARWLQLATDVARAGGVVLLDHQRQITTEQVEFKGHRTELVTAADRAAEHAVVAARQPSRAGLLHRSAPIAALRPGRARPAALRSADSRPR